MLPCIYVEIPHVKNMQPNRNTRVQNRPLFLKDFHSFVLLSAHLDLSQYIFSARGYTLKIIDEN